MEDKASSRSVVRSSIRESSSIIRGNKRKVVTTGTEGGGVARSLVSVGTMLLTSKLFGRSQKE